MDHGWPLLKFVSTPLAIETSVCTDNKPCWPKEKDATAVPIAKKSTAN